jgi:NAD(P)-dependent dehydrogenase (short-subunit alcohol dehydrogenase family)
VTQGLAVSDQVALDDWVEANLQIDELEYAEPFMVNTVGIWYTVLAFARLLQAGNRRANMKSLTSQIIITSSISAYNRSPPGFRAYSQSKAAVTAVAKQLAQALPRWGIRVNVFAPGSERDLCGVNSTYVLCARLTSAQSF